MTEVKVRIAGPTSETIRNTAKQMLALAGQDGLTLMQLQLGCGVLSDCADQVERLEAMTVPKAQRADPRDIESGKVVLFDEQNAVTHRLALGGAVTAPMRARPRGFWGRFQTFMRRI